MMLHTWCRVMMKRRAVDSPHKRSTCCLVVFPVNALLGAHSCSLLRQPHWHYGYVGADWPANITACAGSAQSPINIPGHTAFSLVSAGAESRFDYGTLASDGSNIAVTNNGHTVVVTLPSTFRPVNATVAAVGAHRHHPRVSSAALRCCCCCCCCYCLAAVAKTHIPLHPHIHPSTLLALHARTQAPWRPPS